jgi:hypothetical protein
MSTPSGRRVMAGEERKKKNNKNNVQPNFASLSQATRLEQNFKALPGEKKS